MRTGKAQFRLIILVCITLSIGLNFTSAFGATINVPTVDYPTIQAGIDAAVEGDTVLVADGTYTGAGNKNLDFNGKAITLSSESGPNKTIIDCENDGGGVLFNSDENENSILSGFTITNGNATGIYCYRSSPTITDCIIRGNKGGGINCRYSSPSITKCIIRDNSADRGGGILSEGGSSIITNCVINGNIAETIGGGIHITGSSSLKITNCTISGNSALEGGGGISVGWGASPIITNCILWENTISEIYHGDNTNAVITYCDVQGGHTGEGNFEGDPLFVDAENKDFHLLNNSPCMYAATATGAPDTDIEGNSRPQGYGFDMGAYETTGYDKLRPIVDSFSADVTEGIVPFDVTFACEAHDTDGKIVSYSINYGDGSATETNTSGIFDHTYTLAGSGYATCKVTDDSGASTNSASINIRRSTEIHVPANYSTIQAAIDAASDGDTITVASGTYKGEGNKDLDFKGKAITVISENGPKNTIIDCENNGRGFNFQSGEGQDSVVSGFTITNGKAGDGGGIRIYDSSPTISKCLIINCQTKYTYGDYYGGGIYCRAAYSTDPIAPIIKNCVIADNRSGRRGGGIYCYGSNATITNCTIVNNSTDNSFDASGGGISYSFSSLTITNSIIWLNYPNAGAGGATVTYSNIEGGQPGEGNIDEYPELMDPFIGDYRLQDWSPCIGTATSAGAPALDVIGNPRPNPAGSNPDMGAYENSLAVPVTRPLDVFAMEVGNQWAYDSNTENRVTELDRSNNLRYIYEVEGLVNGNSSGKEWYESSDGKLRWWGFQDDDGYFRYNNGLLVAWFPAAVGDQRQSSAGVIGYIGNISLTVDVLAFEPVILSFDTLDAYKFQLKAKISGPGGKETVTTYWWVVPYLGIVQTQNGGAPRKLTSFAIGRGTITPDTDADGDELKDYEELSIYNTDRLDSDTDDDGLSDGEEVNTHETDPNDNDSDDDGLTDWDEVNTHGTDPNSEDTDNDGLTDFEELYTHNTDPNNEDSDGDELNDGDEIAIGTDPNNSDTDGDGMPDGWEDAYDLDPLTDDAGDDADEDGLTNLEEYEKGRHPTNVEPDAPVLLLPDDAEIDVLLTPQLQTDDFSDTDGHGHELTQWQIGIAIGNPEPCSEESFTNSDYIVFDGTCDDQLTLFKVPDFLLDVDTDYCWRARFTDTGDATSDWSEPFAFKTIATDENDQNQNGIPDDQEVDDPTLDLDDNGVPDANQGDMKCVNTDGGAAQIGVKEGDNVASIECLSWTDPATIDDTQNKPDDMPMGLVSFKLEVANPGDIGKVTVYLSEPAPVGAKWYKYDAINGWQDYSAHAVFSPDRTSVELEFKDGGFGDADGAENAIIIDPSGAGVLSSGSSGGGGGGGGGCFISTATYGSRTLKESLALVLLFGLLMIGFSAFRRKFNK